MKFATCPSCKSVKQHEEMPYGGYYYDNRKMPLVRCDNCDLTFIVHSLSKQEINDFYNVDEYFSSEYAGGGAEVEYESNKVDQDKKAAVALNLISKYKTEGKLLEVGCAGGYLLELAKKKYNFEVRGIEISERMSRFGREKLGLNIHCGTIENVPNDWKNFDVVYMGDVLEHVDEPNQFIELVKNRMNKEGILCLELPFTYNLTLSGIVIGLFNMLKGRFGRLFFLPAQHRENFVKKPPYHLLMFTKKSIIWFLKNHGFSVEYIKIYEGKPKFRFGFKNPYSIIKLFSYYITWFLPQSTIGDRLIIFARKK